jgi:glycosyltransferase involved in cell wall biosynthesis
MTEPVANGVPKVSVVIATYNRAALLVETLDSVLNQNFQDFEVIVVDDGSTDNTREVLRAYANRIRYLYQENRGPSSARNLGVHHARGRWIAIQDSDDLCAIDYLESLYEFACNHEDCGMIFANGGYLDRKERHRGPIIPSEKSHRLFQEGIRLTDLFEKSIVRLQASLISKECYDAVGGHDESLRIAMDLDLAFRMFMRYPMAYLDKVVFFYRRHEGNIGRNQELRLLENIGVIEKLLKDFPQTRETLGRGRVARRLAYRYYRLAKGRWKDGRHEEARQALGQAVTLSPLALKYRLYQLRWA